MRFIIALYEIDRAYGGRERQQSSQFAGIVPPGTFFRPTIEIGRAHV